MGQGANWGQIFKKKPESKKETADAKPPPATVQVTIPGTNEKVIVPIKTASDVDKIIKIADPGPSKVKLPITHTSTDSVDVPIKTATDLKNVRELSTPPDPDLKLDIQTISDEGDTSTVSLKGKDYQTLADEKEAYDKLTKQPEKVDESEKRKEWIKELHEGSKKLNETQLDTGLVVEGMKGNRVPTLQDPNIRSAIEQQQESLIDSINYSIGRESIRSEQNFQNLQEKLKPLVNNEYERIVAEVYQNPELFNKIMDMVPPPYSVAQLDDNQIKVLISNYAKEKTSEWYANYLKKTYNIDTDPVVPKKDPIPPGGKPIPPVDPDPVPPTATQQDSTVTTPDSTATQQDSTVTTPDSSVTQQDSTLSSVKTDTSTTDTSKGVSVLDLINQQTEPDTSVTDTSDYAKQMNKGKPSPITLQEAEDKVALMRDVPRINRDGTLSTVMLGQMDNMVFPTIFPKDPDSAMSDRNEWLDFGDDYEGALEEAKKRGEVIILNSEEDAIKLAEGSWKDDTTTGYKADTTSTVETDTTAKDTTDYAKQMNKGKKDTTGTDKDDDELLMAHNDKYYEHQLLTSDNAMLFDPNFIIKERERLIKEGKLSRNSVPTGGEYQMMNVGEGWFGSNGASKTEAYMSGKKMADITEVFAITPHEDASDPTGSSGGKLYRTVDHDKGFSPEIFQGGTPMPLQELAEGRTDPIITSVLNIERVVSPMKDRGTPYGYVMIYHSDADMIPSNPDVLFDLQEEALDYEKNAVMSSVFNNPKSKGKIIEVKGRKMAWAIIEHSDLIHWTDQLKDD